jgi:hypothetical protein
VVGYTAYIWLLRHCDPAKVATYAYVNPIVAVLLGAAFAGETLTMRTVMAAGLIIGSVAMVITAQQLRARMEPQSAQRWRPPTEHNEKRKPIGRDKRSTTDDRCGQAKLARGG